MIFNGIFLFCILFAGGNSYSIDNNPISEFNNDKKFTGNINDKESKMKKNIQQEQNSKKLKVMALHGGMSCSSSFMKKMSNLSKKTKRIVDFVYLNAPFVTRPLVFESGKAIGHIHEEKVTPNYRSWWGWNSNDPLDSRYAINGHQQDGLFYQNIDQSLELMWGEWSSNNGDYDGIFGFSQGAIMTSIFCDWIERVKSKEIAENPRLRPKFIILISGFMKPVPLNIPEYFTDDVDFGQSLKEATTWLDESGRLPDDFHLDKYEKDNFLGVDGGEYIKTRKFISEIPSLHIFGANDTIMPNERSIALAKKYKNSDLYQHQYKRGHEVPQVSVDIEVVKQFLEKYK